MRRAVVNLVDDWLCETSRTPDSIPRLTRKRRPACPPPGHRHPGLSGDTAMNRPLSATLGHVERSATDRHPAYRWAQLTRGSVFMGLGANLQYGWTLFVNPMEAKNHWGLSAIQLAFPIFVVVETWLVPV